MRAIRAVQLFVENAQRLRPGYQPAATELEPVAQVCRWVGGMPLAILLASSWIELLSPAEIAAQMAGANGQRLDLLAADYQDLPEGQRSMRAVFDHSWRLLSEREQGMLAALSVFPGSFGAPAAQEVAGASLRDLLRLADRSLLLRLAEGRYILHDLLREYAAEQLRHRRSKRKSRATATRLTIARALYRWQEDGLKTARQLQTMREMERRVAQYRDGLAACRRAGADSTGSIGQPTAWAVTRFSPTVTRRPSASSRWPPSG